MTRRCSHCSNNGHNSRTCPNRGGVTGGSGGASAGVKLFGFRLIDGTMMKKSASMSSLSAHFHSPLSLLSLNPGSPSSDPVPVADGYLSDDLAHGSSNRRAERKKGVPWTEEEHRLFLIGLQKLGKGDWRGIARNYVTSRTPTQVASHAQKYFIRQSNVSRRKRRSSLFDMSTDVEVDPLSSMPEEPALPPPLPLVKEPDNLNPMPSLNLSLISEFEPMEISPRPQEPQVQETEETTIPQGAFPVFTYFPAPLPIPFPVWPAIKVDEMPRHRVLKPIPLLPKEPVNVEALVGMSQLSLVETEARAREPSPLSLKLLGEPSRQSAFHVKAPGSGSELGAGETSPIQAV